MSTECRHQATARTKAKHRPDISASVTGLSVSDANLTMFNTASTRVGSNSRSCSRDNAIANAARCYNQQTANCSNPGLAAKSRGKKSVDAMWLHAETCLATVSLNERGGQLTTAEMRLAPGFQSMSPLSTKSETPYAVGPFTIFLGTNGRCWFTNGLRLGSTWQGIGPACPLLLNKQRRPKAKSEKPGDHATAHQVIPALPPSLVLVLAECLLAALYGASEMVRLWHRRAPKRGDRRQTAPITALLGSLNPAPPAPRRPANEPQPKESQWQLRYRLID